MKPTNNRQGPMVPVTEQIVGRAGVLIGAPTCEVRTAAVPQAIQGWEFRPGHSLEPGIAHACLEVENAVEVRQRLERRNDDDNASRHVYIMALFDWCFGDDAQWLSALDDNGKFYSHDHGWYLPPNGPNLTEAAMRAEVDRAHELTDPGDGIVDEDVLAAADSLRAVSRDDLLEVLTAIPQQWSVSNADLERVGSFLEARAPAAADRLITRFGAST